jgi:hypothetical protein
MFSRALVIAAVLSGCVHSDRAAVTTAVGATACDWGATRNAAMDGWATQEEVNAVLGSSPTPTHVDAYFAAIVGAEVLTWLVVPPRYRTIVFGVISAVELRTAQLNMRTIGVCGVTPRTTPPPVMSRR